MSMNLYIKAVLSAETKLGKKYIQETFGLWQTPTKDTYAILDAEDNADILDAYKTWVYGRKSEEAAEHIKELADWINSHKEWTICWYTL